MRIPIALRVSIPLVVLAIAIAFQFGRVQAQTPERTPAQISVGAPLPVFVTNSPGIQFLPEGFVPGSRWRFTTYSAPSVLTWVATVNKTSGPWANLTITEQQGSRTQWYYIAAMPGSWEQQ